MGGGRGGERINSPRKRNGFGDVRDRARGSLTSTREEHGQGFGWVDPWMVNCLIRIRLNFPIIRSRLSLPLHFRVQAPLYPFTAATG
jgi:hypothetical protein